MLNNIFLTFSDEYFSKYPNYYFSFIFFIKEFIIPFKYVENISVLISYYTNIINQFLEYLYKTKGLIFDLIFKEH